jgi:spermidine/putrescine-binding protein
MIRILCSYPRKDAMFRGSKFAPALLCVLAILIVGCGKTNSGAGPTPATADAEKVVNFYIWADYVAPDTLSSFEKLIASGSTLRISTRSPFRRLGY